MLNFAAAKKINWAHILVPMGFVLGWYMDKQQDQKLTGFRNKSALYKRELKPGEKETWK
ncbi:NADH dehydrogenase [ubiquinone] 1 beta subcomplex subunit 1-like [Kryptolebias marmoratus]|uniref:NADH dehydrogenase [ubiquinone] 1 beta subcomplex subunit 1 n=1 Tax=Kryptolebias marmoratus TaxID=37003 RepID=A0A3Q3B9C3_KRYMA|nr:NADH dehydrogenase [ubiquinone] 1 beta subcomplex subunit 1-like [Kryptolebias marmoratus]